MIISNNPCSRNAAEGRDYKNCSNTAIRKSKLFIKSCNLIVYTEYWHFKFICDFVLPLCTIHDSYKTCRFLKWKMRKFDYLPIIFYNIISCVLMRICR